MTHLMMNSSFYCRLFEVAEKCERALLLVHHVAHPDQRHHPGVLFARDWRLGLGQGALVGGHRELPDQSRRDRLLVHVADLLADA